MSSNSVSHASCPGQNYSDFSKGAIPKTTVPQSPAARPEDLRVTPWYLDDLPPNTPPAPYDPSTYPSYSYSDKDSTRPDLPSTQNSSMEGEVPSRPPGAPRKAYMDLRDAIAMLDETCPNPEPSPLLTPRTPRTPLTPYPRSKRARSKSSDNSSNYSNDRLSERSLEAPKPQAKDKKRPFLRIIGISKTEDRPFLAKFAPRIIGKPYLQKIGPSKAVEKPFLDKIGSSKTVEKFTFNTPCRESKFPVKPSPEKTEASPKEKVPTAYSMHQRDNLFGRRSGKGYLLKMYSFETEDLNSLKEPTSPMKSPRDPMHGASLDDFLDSGHSSLPPLEGSDMIGHPDSEHAAQSGAELVKCKMMSHEDIISSNSCSTPTQGSATTWANSPQSGSNAIPKTTAHRRQIFQNSVKSDAKKANSPIKRQISTDSPEPKSKELAILKPGEMSPSKTRNKIIEAGNYTLPKQRDVFPYKNRAQTLKDDELLAPINRRQASEDTLDRMEDLTRNSKIEDYERRGISSDNLKLSREPFTLVSSDVTMRCQSQDICEQRKDTFSKYQDVFDTDQEISSISQDFSKEMFKQLHNKFELRNMASESHIIIKHRGDNSTRQDTRPNKSSRDNMSPGDVGSDPLEDSHLSRRERSMFHTCNMTVRRIDTEESPPDEQLVPQMKDSIRIQEQNKIDASSRSQDRCITVRSVLRKQESIDNQSDQEPDTRSLRRPPRRIFHETSQETMDLLTELRKVKSLLRSPSIETIDKAEEMKPTRFPKKILLTDREFCLSIERDNSIRRPSKLIGQEMSEDVRSSLKNRQSLEEPDGDDRSKATEETNGLTSPASFEKRCLSLDYVDDEKPQSPETPTVSLASARIPPSETEETVDSFELALNCAAQNCSTDVFKASSVETEEKETSMEKMKEFENSKDIEMTKRNHCLEVDIAIPIDQKTSPRRRVHIQARTSDLYEIISPRSTPFRVKKRLSKISVEETMKQESFSLGKVDCRSIAVQKRTKCFPL